MAKHKGGFKVKATSKMEHEHKKHKGGKRRSRKRR